MMNTDQPMLAALALSGLLGSLGHCLGMCGPLVLMMGAQVKTRGSARLPAHLLYHGGRIAVYALLGALTGGLGSLLGIGPSLNRLAGWISLALGLGVLAFGLSYIGWLPLKSLAGTAGWWNRAAAQAFKAQGSYRIMLLGALNGILPCGLVYSALLIAATAGSAPKGALGMALFGLGTLPALVIVGLGAGALSVRVRQTLTRLSGFLILLVGLQLALRGLAALNIVPPLKIGGSVIW